MLWAGTVPLRTLLAVLKLGAPPGWRLFVPLVSTASVTVNAGQGRGGSCT